MKKLILLFLYFSFTFIYSQTTTLQRIPDYNDWGWEALVMKNDLITVAAVPVIGGRIMQYDLSEFSSVFVNPSEFGKTYTPSQFSPWHNFGGYKTWPAPQSDWSNGGWPPPPNLDYGAYAFSDSVVTEDSVSITLTSPAEQWFSPDLRFERTSTIYTGLSRVKMEQKIINEGANAVTWSVWDVTQSIVQSDFENYWVYFPINPNSLYGESGVYFRDLGSLWTGDEAAPGVYGIEFLADENKLFADPDKGWIAYAVLSDSTVFVKTFEVFEGEEYPDNGSRIAVYVSGPGQTYFEVEVTSPLVELAPSEDYTFTENWWACRVHAPILDADSVGVIASRLSYNQTSNEFTANYGVFYTGTAKITFIDSSGQIINEGDVHSVSPLEEFRLKENIVIPDNASAAEVQIYNDKNEFAGVLERTEISNLPTSVKEKAPAAAAGFRLFPNYPNPFNGNTVLTFYCSRPTEGSLKIYDLIGNEIAVLTEGKLAEGNHRINWSPGNLAGGVYFAKFETPEAVKVQKMIYLR